MSCRYTLSDIRAIALREMRDGDWWSATRLAQLLGVGHGRGWLMVALALERLAADGALELRGERVRKFRIPEGTP